MARFGNSGQRAILLDAINKNMTYEEGHKITTVDGHELSAEEQYELSSNQAVFCNDAEKCGLDIDFAYSGRGMYGKCCPAVRCDEHNDIATHAKVRVDGMGRGVVIYARF